MPIGVGKYQGGFFILWTIVKKKSPEINWNLRPVHCGGVVTVQWTIMVRTLS